MSSIRFAAITVAVSLTAAGALAGVASAADVIPARGAPTLGPDNVVPSDFSATITNPWFPLRAGNVYRYTGTKDGRRATVVTRVTHNTKRIMGVPCAVIFDRLYVHGRLAEDTVDWYTQDKRGNVWYLGEATATYQNGKVASRDGSFLAGRDGARGGIFMPAAPRVGQEFQQELAPGHAEDRFRVASLNATTTVPFVTSHRALRTLEWTPLEPAVLDAKFYIRGIGVVSETQVRGPGPKEQLQLTSFTRG